MAMKLTRQAEMTNEEYLAYVAPKILAGQRPHPHIVKAKDGNPKQEMIRWNKPVGKSA